MSNAPCIRYLRDYVAIPSVNPMRRTDIAPEIAGEACYAEHLREQVRRLRLDAERLGPSERPSVLAEVRALDELASQLARREDQASERASGARSNRSSGWRISWCGY